MIASAPNLARIASVARSAAARLAGVGVQQVGGEVGLIFGREVARCRRRSGGRGLACRRGRTGRARRGRCGRSVGSGRSGLWRRVTSWKSPRFSFSVTVRPDRRLALARSATCSDSRQMWPSRRSGSEVSSKKVVSFEIDFSFSSRLTRRVSRPRARCHSRSPIWPKRASGRRGPSAADRRWCGCPPVPARSGWPGRRPR